MKARLLLLAVFSMVALLVVVLSSALPVAAQRPTPTPVVNLPESRDPGPTPQPKTLARSPSASTATGGPDQFSYTWNDMVAFNDSH